MGAMTTASPEGKRGRGAKVSLDTSLLPARSTLEHTADSTHRHQQARLDGAHQCEGGVQGGDHHVSNGQVYDEEVGGRVHPLVLDDHVAHQDVAEERDADDHRVGNNQQRLHRPALGLTLILGSTVEVPQVLQVQVTVEEGLVRGAIQCREEIGGVVVLCSPEGLGHVLRGEPVVLSHGWGSRALVQPHTPQCLLPAQLLKPVVAGGNTHTCVLKICPMVAN